MWTCSDCSVEPKTPSSHKRICNKILNVDEIPIYIDNNYTIYSNIKYSIVQTRYPFQKYIKKIVTYLLSCPMTVVDGYKSLLARIT